MPQLVKIYRFLSLIILLACLIKASTVRIMTYNLLNFEDENDRENDFRTIISIIEPDLIMVQEISGQTGFFHFKSDVLDLIEPNTWTGASFINQTASQDIALYYRHDLFTFISTSEINTAQTAGTRDVIEWKIIHNASAKELSIYGVHFKASSGQTNAAQRLEEATVLRNYLNSLDENYFIVGGDFNIYSNNQSSEPAFEMLTGISGNNNGRLFDPINRIGHWHNNSSFADVHTQSPRTSSFGGGAPGGMDDRFDWLFVSAALLSDSSDIHYIEDSYETFGNDGNHFNQAINSGNNMSVSNAIANALHDASDHLPVYMDLFFNDLTYAFSGISITEIMPDPSMVSDSYGEWFEIFNSNDTSININGWIIKDLDDDYHIIGSEGLEVIIEPGEYVVMARNDNQSLNGGISVGYQYSNFTLSSNDEIILTNSSGAILDEVHYTDSWAYDNGVSMEIHDIELDNGIYENWFSSIAQYGNGDYGTPGASWQSLNVSDIFQILKPQFSLMGAFPNPFNSSTSIKFNVFSSGKYFIKAYTLNGSFTETLFEGALEPGSHDFQWVVKNKPSGIYLIKMESTIAKEVKKVLHLK